EMVAITQNGVTGPNNQVDVQARVAQFDFSSHSDGNELLQFVKSLQFKNGERKVYCIHGDRDNCEHLAKSINDQVPGANAIAPKKGDSCKI
nr:MBL fold metallo-hydrolase RNA specificity domain-containing protein [Candidatus Sigynarchaeota archaeon]